MRRILFAFALLTACEAAPPLGPDGAGTSALMTEEIQTSSLDAAPTGGPSVADAAKDPPRPEPRPQTAVDPPEEPVPDLPVVAKSADQVLCERTGGQWAVAGQSGAHSCVKATRDGGKTCTKEDDCMGMCLARSGTCAPLMPLFGCNEVLDKQGRRVTLCID